MAVLPQLAERGSDRAAVLVQVDDAGIYVGGPGYRRGVAQVGGDLGHDAGDGALAGGVAAVGALRHGQAYRGQHGRVPGAEVLGRVISSGYLPEGVADVRRRDVVPAPTGRVHQHLVPAAAPPPQAPHHGAHLVLGYRLLAMLGALGGILEYELPLGERDVLLPDGGQAEGTVLVRVLLAPRAEEAKIDQPDSGRKDSFPGQAAGAQVLTDLLAYGRQDGAELPNPVMLGQVPLLTPQIVVEVLAAPGRVGAQGLDVAPRIGADPDVLPGRRDHQRFDMGQRPRVVDGRGIGPEVGEPAPAAPAPDSGPVEVAPPQRAAGYGRLLYHYWSSSATGRARLQTPRRTRRVLIVFSRVRGTVRYRPQGDALW